MDFMADAAWKVTLHGGQGWQCEVPPQGLDPWPYSLMPSLNGAVPGPSRALAASYSWCELMQASAMPPLFVAEGL
jgi:hypothetical protein